MSIDSKVTYQEACRLLKSGQVVAVPTETVYGLAGRIDLKHTLEQIFYLKKRPTFDPLIVHCYDVTQAQSYMLNPNSLVIGMLKYFSPGPLTVVVPKNEKIDSIITASQNTVALRIPQHKLLRKLLKELQVPLAAPSANLYSKLSPTKAEDVTAIFKTKVSVLDGGECDVGLESTIVQPDFKNKQIVILRPGIISKKDLELFLKSSHLDYSIVIKETKYHPGESKDHYQPDVPLVLVRSTKSDSEIYDFLKSKYPNHFIKQMTLKQSPQVIARHLYSNLRQLSQNPNHIIFVIQHPNQKGEIWDALWNRLEKAASQTFLI